jgi:hypothetical protein
MTEIKIQKKLCAAEMPATHEDPVSMLSTIKKIRKYEDL